MPILNLPSVWRGEARVEGEIPVDDPLWEGTVVTLLEPLRVDLRAHSVGEGVFLRGPIHARLARECRRCLRAVEVVVEDSVDLLYEPLQDEERDELEGEVYPLPSRGDEVDLGPALREQLLLRIPEFVVCSDACRGLCPQCGTDLNEATCSCVPDPGAGPWDALKTLKFD